VEILGEKLGLAAKKYFLPKNESLENGIFGKKYWPRGL
jgi:hypothetical protein